MTKIRKHELRSGLKFDVASEFRKRTLIMAKGYHELLEAPRNTRVVVVQGDAREWSQICSQHEMIPDLVITSPCYLSAIEYWRRHKLEYCWLGLVSPQNLSEMRHTFLGMGAEDPDTSNLSPYLTRMYKSFVRSGFNREASNFARYFSDSESWLREVSEVISRSNGTAYVVVGPNYTRGHKVDTARGLQEMASEAHLKASVLLHYGLKNYHMQYPTKGDIRIREETVLRFVPN